MAIKLFLTVGLVFLIGHAAATDVFSDVSDKIAIPAEVPQGQDTAADEVNKLENLVETLQDLAAEEERGVSAELDEEPWMDGADDLMSPEGVSQEAQDSITNDVKEVEYLADALEELMREEDGSLSDELDEEVSMDDLADETLGEAEQLVRGIPVRLARVCEHQTVSIRCPAGQQINIVSALYGRTTRAYCSNGPIRTTNCRSSNSLARVRTSCQGKSSCSVGASNSVFGDPCYGTFKYLEVGYTCAGASSRRVCEHQTLTMTCPAGRQINIVSALYGRTTRAYCSTGPIRTTNCRSSNSLARVRTSCQGKSSCSVGASNSVFGDPCYGTFKYLEVGYTCAAGASSRRVCEHQTLTMTCPAGRQINIASALYGRTTRAYCSNGPIRTTNCRSSNSLARVRTSCQGKSSCSVGASNSVFGDPCYGTFKYLEVGYTCAGAGTGWKQIDGGLKFVSVGPSGVWGVNSGDQIYYRTGTYKNEASPGTGWVRIDGALKQISSGNDIVWGVNSNDDIYLRLGIGSRSPQGSGWRQIAGKLKQVHVSPTSNQVWGVNSADNIYRRTGITASNPAGTGWQQIDGLLKFVSVGRAGVWGVNTHDQIFYRTGTAGNEASPGTGWVQVIGGLKQISSGNGEIWGVNSNNQIFVRRGLNAGTPQGSSWQLIQGALKEVYISSSSNQVWGVNAADNIFRRVGQSIG